MSLPVKIVRYIVAYVAAVLVTYVLAAFFYTLLVNAELASVVDVPIGAYITGTWQNIVGLSGSAFGGFVGTYLGVVVIGLLIAFLVAFYLKHTMSFPLALVGAALAGIAVAIGSYLMDNAGEKAALFAGAVTIPIALAANLLITRLLPFLRPIAYPAAGFAAVGVALYLIGWNLGLAAMAGAREPGGFVLQMIAGLVGGIVFAILTPDEDDELVVAAPAAVPA